MYRRGYDLSPQSHLLYSLRSETLTFLASVYVLSGAAIILNFESEIRPGLILIGDS